MKAAEESLQKTKESNGEGKMLTRMIRDEGGQDIIENALLMAFISLAAIGTLSSIGVSIESMYYRIVQALIGHY